MAKSQASFSDDIDDAVLQELYSWVDQIPLSRPKKNLSRDFSDGGRFNQPTLLCSAKYDVTFLTGTTFQCASAFVSSYVTLLFTYKLHIVISSST